MKLSEWIAWKRRVFALELVIWAAYSAIQQIPKTQKWFGETLKAVGDDMIRLSGGQTH